MIVKLYPQEITCSMVMMVKDDRCEQSTVQDICPRCQLFTKLETKVLKRLICQS